MAKIIFTVKELNTPSGEAVNYLHKTAGDIMKELINEKDKLKKTA